MAELCTSVCDLSYLTWDTNPPPSRPTEFEKYLIHLIDMVTSFWWYFFQGKFFCAVQGFSEVCNNFSADSHDKYCMLYFSVGELRKKKVAFLWSLIWLELLIDSVWNKEINRTVDAFSKILQHCDSLLGKGSMKKHTACWTPAHQGCSSCRTMASSQSRFSIKQHVRDCWIYFDSKG